MCLNAVLLAAMVASTPAPPPCPGPEAGCGAIHMLDYRASASVPLIEVRRRGGSRSGFRSWHLGGVQRSLGSVGSSTAEGDRYRKIGIAATMLAGATLLVRYVNSRGRTPGRAPSRRPASSSTSCPSCGAPMVLAAGEQRPRGGAALLGVLDLPGVPRNPARLRAPLAALGTSGRRERGPAHRRTLGSTAALVTPDAAVASRSAALGC